MRQSGLKIASAEWGVVGKFQGTRGADLHLRGGDGMGKKTTSAMVLVTQSSLAPLRIAYLHYLYCSTKFK